MPDPIVAAMLGYLRALVGNTVVTGAAKDAYRGLRDLVLRKFGEGKGRSRRSPGHPR
jgi:hypothetical protein